MSKDEIDEVKHIIEESNHVKETSSKNQNEDRVSTSTENIETHSTNSVTSKSDEFISTERSTEPSTNLDSSTKNMDVEMFGGFQPVAGPSLEG